MATDSATFALARVPARTVLTSIGAVWLTYFAIATLRSWIDGIGLFDALLERRVLVTLASMVVTALLWPVLRLLDPRPIWQKALVILVLAMPASLLLAQINQWVFADIEAEVQARIGEQQGLRIRSDPSGNLLVDPLESAPLPDPVDEPAAAAGSAAITIDASVREDNRWSDRIDLALTRYFIVLAWAAIYLALVNAEQARAAERREGEFRRAAKAAELRSLRYQINPHFLFNTLNSLSAQVITGKTDAAEKMIQTLAAFYRHSLADEPTGDVELADEIALQQHYLEIEAVRFPERLRVEIDVAPALGQLRVPGMILQPLIENSVKYAVAALARPVTVRIAALVEFERLVLTVSDDGPGQPGAGPAGFGIGLVNVRDRLAARFGDLATFNSGPCEGGGWRSVIRMPLVSHG
jgi:signal transduction histidine kinase